MLSAQVYDVIATTEAALQAAHPADVDGVRQLPPLVQFGDNMRAKSHALKAFLLQQLYRHPQVLHTTGHARQVVSDLFGAYVSAPHEMPERYQRRADQAGDTDPAAVTARAVADYIAGMTDRFALREHTRLTGKTLLN
jgi:dGTPase